MQHTDCLHAPPRLRHVCVHTPPPPPQFNVTLQELTLAAFPAQFQADDLAALQTALAAGRRRLRVALLMGTHKQLGAGSPLQQLPSEVRGRAAGCGGCDCSETMAVCVGG